MSLISKFYRVALVFCLVLTLSAVALADTIRLKDGSIIKGKIINFGDGKFVVLIGEGSRQRQMSFFADEVESIEFDNSAIPVSNAKTTLPTYTDTSAKRDTTSSPNVNVPKPIENTQPTNSPRVLITDKSSTNNSGETTPRTSNTPVAKPITINVRVLADNTANGWSNSNWVVKKGQRIRITGRGQVNLGGNRFSSPAGIASLPDKDKLIPSQPTGGLIAVIGDDNNDFIFIGASREFVAQRDGALFLGVNEGNLDDNTGAFDVTIEIIP